MPSIRTERLLLRPYREEDAEALAAHRSDPDVARYVHWSPPYSLGDAKALIERTRWTGQPLRVGVGALVAVERIAAPGTVIGDCAVGMSNDDELQASLGYTLSPPFQGQGYATEAARAVLAEVFAGDAFTARPLHRVIALCDVENLPSQRVLERLGFRREGHFVENLFLKGRWASGLQYAQLRGEWLQRTG